MKKILILIIITNLFANFFTGGLFKHFFDPAKGWTDSNISEMKEYCERFTDNSRIEGRQYKRGWLAIRGGDTNCDCIIDAVSKSISFKDFKNLEPVGHEIMLSETISPVVIAASMNYSNTINTKEATMIQDELRDCCRCNSKLCDTIFIVTEFIINPEKVLYTNERYWPRWCEN
tara:strand:+ start:92 stop:613 length:522 start_codon:yes stop_codon:yes gene_type:complete